MATSFGLAVVLMQELIFCGIHLRLVVYRFVWQYCQGRRIPTPPVVDENKRLGVSIIVVGVSTFVVLSTFRYFTVDPKSASSGGQRHPRFDNPPGTNHAGRGLEYSISNERLLTAELPNLVFDEVLTHETEDTQHNATTKRDRPDGDRNRSHVNLVIFVPSVRPERRDAIRKTWLNWVDDRVVLRFFTEAPNEAEHENHQEIAALLAHESLAHGDIVIQDIHAGMNFGVKLLEAMRWMSQRFSFDFFLRLDDDYFLCLERLLNELSCLLESGTRQAPFYAGSRVCGKVPYIDEAYILLSSVVVDRVLAASHLNCTATGSLTSAAWVRKGGPGNPQGDVAWVVDPRLDYMGQWWKESKTGRICEHGMGVHSTYPDQMKEYWEELSGKMNASQSAVDGCQDVFPYEDDGRCPAISLGADYELFERLKKDNLQPCDSFKPENSKMWCGKQGC